MLYRDWQEDSSKVRSVATKAPGGLYQRTELHGYSRFPGVLALNPLFLRRNTDSARDGPRPALAPCKAWLAVKGTVTRLLLKLSKRLHCLDRKQSFSRTD